MTHPQVETRNPNPRKEKVFNLNILKHKNKKQMWFCYILRNKQEQYKYLTYNGFTNNPKKRLRQHNEEIKGGARYTHGKGGGWEIYALLSGFHTNINALSCEWLIKHPSGKLGKRHKSYNSPIGRIKSLNHILQKTHWTSKCIINNNECNYKLLLTTDVASHLDIPSLPKNITVTIHDVIDLDQIDILSDKYDDPSVPSITPLISPDCHSFIDASPSISTASTVH